MNATTAIPVVRHSTLATVGGIGWGTVRGTFMELQTVKVIGDSHAWDKVARKPKLLVLVRPV